MINDVISSLSLRDKILIGAGGLGLVAGVALSILLGLNSTLFSPTVPVHDYFWGFPTVAVAGLVVLNIPIGMELGERTKNTWDALMRKQAAKAKKQVQQEASSAMQKRIDNILSIGKTPQDETCQSMQTLSDLEALAQQKEEATALNSWFNDILLQTIEKRKETTDMLFKEQKELKAEIDLTPNPTEELYRKAIFIAIKLDLLNQNTTPISPEYGECAYRHDLSITLTNLAGELGGITRRKRPESCNNSFSSTRRSSLGPLSINSRSSTQSQRDSGFHYKPPELSETFEQALTSVYRSLINNSLRYFAHGNVSTPSNAKPRAPHSSLPQQTL